MVRATRINIDGLWHREAGTRRVRPLDMERIIAVLEAEKGLIADLLCNPRQRVCGHAGRCAMGALMFAAGVTNKELQDGFGDAWTQRIQVKLFNAYGLTCADATAIISLNDAAYDPDEVTTPEWRARAVLDVIRQYLDEHRVGRAA